MKYIFNFIILTAILILATAGTSYVSTVLYPGVISINGQIKEVSEDYGILNYNDRVYVPIRYISEQLGAEISYDHESKQISVYHMDGRNLVSNLNAAESQGGYNLSIYSEKGIYEEGEPLRIWSVLRNDSESTKYFYSGNPVIIFYFKDDEGNIFYGNKQDAVAKPNFLKGNDQIHIQIPYTPQKYYLEKEGSTVVEGELTEPYFLPKGKYTVGAMAPLTDLNPLKEEVSFEDENSFEENVGIDLKAEIIIEIK